MRLPRLLFVPIVLIFVPIVLILALGDRRRCGVSPIDHAILLAILAFVVLTLSGRLP